MKRKKILFICTGNTCRSPMVEALLRSKIKKNKIKWWDVASCGISAENGDSISENSRLVLKESGIENEKFKSRRVTAKMVSAATLVVCMTDAQKLSVENKGNVVSVRDICGSDVPDPYGCGIDVYRNTRDALSEVCDIIIKKFITQYKG